ncbi:hypothetical protein [Burkholderia pseudomultivorans]|uniref:hypothetical protein n=1 Tax=Burkholderia pseudomultivorans TaxID=1207504 RepID=UPI0012D86394|nr:hypothetical protein [Burkholderia pseudomultivorans]MBF5012881.1 hypothetical protein [Burkholderia pseudomultivorans]
MNARQIGSRSGFSVAHSANENALVNRLFSGFIIPRFLSGLLRRPFPLPRVPVIRTTE